MLCYVAISQYHFLRIVSIAIYEFWVISFGGDRLIWLGIAAALSFVGVYLTAAAGIYLAFGWPTLAVCVLLLMASRIAAKAVMKGAGSWEKT